MEELTLDGLALHDDPWRILDGTFTFTPAKKKLNWASSALSDGAALIGKEDHYENAELSFRLRMIQQPDSDTAFSVLHDLTAKLQAARDVRDGLPLTWTPANSSLATTFYVLDAEYDELGTTNEAGWTRAALQVVVHLYLRPFGYGPEQLVPLGLSDPFVVDSISNGLWRWDAGTGTMTTGLGVMAMTSTSTKRIYRPSTMVDQTTTIRLKIGTSKASGNVGVIARRKDANNRLIARFDPAAGTVLIVKSEGSSGGGTPTTLATSASFTASVSTYYWLQASFVGDDISVAIYADVDSPLTTAGTPITSTSYTLTGAESQFQGARGNPGITVTPADTGWQIDQFTLRGASDIRNSEPIFAVELLDVPGEVEAEGRLVITENSAQNRSHFEWGRETRGYDPNFAPPFLLDSDVLTTSGFAGTQQAVGQYDPDATGNSAVFAQNISETVPLTVCSTGDQLHVGTFKVKAHVSGTAGIMFRLAWRVGDGPLARNNFTEPILGTDWQEIDLGTIIVPEAGIGSQTWEGRIEAFGVATGGLIVDYLELIPLEGYGVARAPLQPITPTVYAAYDHFNQAAPGTMHGATLGTGGTWVVAGGTWTNIDTTNHWAQRTNVSDASLIAGCFALAGSTNYAGIQAQVDVGTVAALDKTVNYESKLRMGLVLRYVDSNNFMLVVRETHSVPKAPGITNDYTHSTRLRVYKRVAGTVTQIGTKQENELPEVHRRLVATVDGTGVWSVYSYWPGAKQPAQPFVSGQDSDLATGGVLDDGKIGLYDAYTLGPTPTLTRTYDNFVAFAPVPDVVMYSGKHLQVRADRTEREATSGGKYAKVPMYRGGRFFLPPAGDTGRTSRVAVKARRTDVDGGLPDSQIADSITVQVFATPRYLTP